MIPVLHSFKVNIKMIDEIHVNNDWYDVHVMMVNMMIGMMLI